MRTPRWWSDPFVAGLGLFVGLVVFGFCSIALAWRAAARTLIVGAQIPPLVSGGLGGLGLVILGTGFAVLHLSRQAATDQRAEMDRLLDEAAGIADALRTTKKKARRG